MKRFQKPIDDEPGKEKRSAVRFATALPLVIKGVEGLIRNLSSTGLYFETNTALAPGSKVFLAVEVKVQGQKSKVLCDATVLRMDHKTGQWGVATRLDAPFFSETAVVVDIGPDFSGVNH